MTPICLNHPDRPGVAYYKGGFALCPECLKDRHYVRLGLPLDEDGATIGAPVLAGGLAPVRPAIGDRREDYLFDTDEPWDFDDGFFAGEGVA